MRIKGLRLNLWILSLVFGGLCGPWSYGSLFQIPHFVNEGKFALGLEPELVFTGGLGGSGGLNFKGSYGASETGNVLFQVGMGPQSRGFRAGGGAGFDFFPDYEGQPGIGLAVQGVYFDLGQTSSVEVAAIPYIHKGFQIKRGPGFEPFLALPVGLRLSDGMYQVQTSVVFGALFEHSARWSSVFEVGVGLNNAFGSVSGGVIYYP